MSIEEITNYRRVSDTLASSGQPTEAQFKDIARAGFEVVINLAMPNSDNALPEEGGIVTARKMTYVHLPVPFDAPTAAHLRSFFRLMAAFEGQRCWVHCVMNYRVSAFLYQYFRLEQQVEDDQARHVMIPNWSPDKIWQAFMALEQQDIGI